MTVHNIRYADLGQSLSSIIRGSLESEGFFNSPTFSIYPYLHDLSNYSPAGSRKRLTASLPILPLPGERFLRHMFNGPVHVQHPPFAVCGRAFVDQRRRGPGNLLPGLTKPQESFQNVPFTPTERFSWTSCFARNHGNELPWPPGRDSKNDRGIRGRMTGTLS